MGLRRRYFPHPHTSFRSRHSQRVPVAVQLRGVKSHSRPRLRSWIQDLLHVRHDQHRWNGDLLAVSLVSLPIGEECRLTHYYLVACSLIPETKGRSLEEMDIIFGAVDAEKRKADIAQEERAFENVPPSPEADSVRSDFEKA